MQAASDKRWDTDRVVRCIENGSGGFTLKCRDRQRQAATAIVKGRCEITRAVGEAEERGGQRKAKEA
jgi:hypothetical protein